MIASVRYGKTAVELPVSVMASAEVLQPAFPIENISDEMALDRFRRAVGRPVGGPALREIAAGRKSACIIVSDKTREYGAGVWMPALLDELNAAGVPDGRITVLFATGAHSGHNQEEREGIVGSEAAGRVRLVDHDCDNSGSVVALGKTPAGAPVSINRLAAEAELLIVTGVVMPHYYAGFTGGRKSIVPGVAARETIFANHSLNLAPGGGTDPRARTAEMTGNPIHEDLMKALRFVRVDFSIQAVPDRAGRPAAFFAGGIIESHEAACALAAEWFCVPIAARAPWVVASCGGRPKDINFYQSHKSLDNAFRAVAPGGTIFLLAECPEGPGPEDFVKWFDIGDPVEIEARLRRSYEVAGHTALRTIEKTRSARVILMSELPDGFVLKMGMTPAGIEELEKIAGSASGKGFILPQAALTAPVIRPA